MSSTLRPQRVDPESFVTHRRSLLSNLTSPSPDCDDPISTHSLPTSSSLGSNLLAAVRVKVRVSSASRSVSNSNAQPLPEARLNADGVSSDTTQSRPKDSLRSASIAEHWQSLAHLFDQDYLDQEQERQSRRRSKRFTSSRFNSPSSPTPHHPRICRSSSSMSASVSSPLLDTNQPALSSAISHKALSRFHNQLSSSSTSAQGSIEPNVAKGVAWSRLVSGSDAACDTSFPSTQESSFYQEPDSWILGDPDETPLGDDPLRYANQEQLLDSDSDSESDGDTEYNGNNTLADDTGTFVTLGIPNASDDNTQQPICSHSWNLLENSTTPLRRYLKDKTTLTPLKKSIIKCSIAYLVASLFTFSPFLSSRMARLLPNHDENQQKPFSNLHMIATVAVNFHPAKSIGAMLEGDSFALIAFIFSITVGFVSMTIAVYLHEVDMFVTSDIISVLLFVGFGMSLVGFAKIKVNKPQFTTACSLTSIIVFTVVVKEGSKHLGHFSTEKTLQVALVVMAGSIVSNLVCFAIWPQSATTNLQNDMVRNLHGFSTLLRALTKTFLLDDPSNFHFKSDKIKRAMDDHHDSFTSLKKDLAEAKLEAFFDLRMRGMGSKYEAATDSLNRLAQHLAGLRSSCGLQHDIRVSRLQARKLHEQQPNSLEQVFQGASLPFMDSSTHSTGISAQLGEDLLDQRAHAFEDFIESVGPHMRSLVFTCSRTLGSLRSTFMARDKLAEPESRQQAEESFVSEQRGQAPQGHVKVQTKLSFQPGLSFEVLETDISAALRRFEHEQTVAIKRIYTMEPKKVKEQKAAAAAASSTSQNVSASTSSLLGRMHPDEEIFLIFFFVFNLEEFAKELIILIEALEVIRKAEEAIVIARATSLSQRIRFYFATSGWLGKSLPGKLNLNRPKIQQTVTLDFPSSRRHAINTAQTPAAMTFKQKFQRLVWTIGEVLRQPDTKFAIKAGVGSAILASPAFFPQTRHVFTKYQGQWALVSFMAVLSPTVGQSNQMSLHRIIGTVIGASAALGIYNLFPDDNVALPIFGLFFSLPCFRFIIGKPQYASAARFVLLAYNLTALYSYNVRKVGIEVEEIAYQRTISVTVGVLWATVFNQLVWPFEARRELGLGISDLLFKLAWLYQRLVLSYSVDLSKPPQGEQVESTEDPEQQPLLRSRQASRTRYTDEFQAIELHLQVSIIKLEDLLMQTKNEPRLKGPFPIATYKAMLVCCQNILDKLHSMRCVTAREDWYQYVRRDFVIPVNSERREMVGNVLLYFYTLGSAFHLKIPVPPYFPPASQCRLWLLDKIRKLPVVQRKAVRGSSAYLLFYSYALAMKDVIDQLEELGRLTQQTFGIWGGSVEDFERHFEASPESANPTPYASKKPSKTNLRDDYQG